MSKHYVVVREVWSQCSSDYNAVRNTATLVVRPETTVADIMAWAERHGALGTGHLVLTEAEATGDE